MMLWRTRRARTSLTADGGRTTVVTRAGMWSAAAFILGAMGCGQDAPATATPPTQRADVCVGFPAWESSPYVLPYPAGSAFVVNQANCSGFGHSGFWKYGYDFTMQIGTLVTAARGGRVLHSEGGGRDGDRTRTNLVTIVHDDGTVAVYSHLTENGALVRVGERVAAGDAIGRSGDTGNTGGFPHLHFSLHPCQELPGLPGGDETSCPTIPVTFRNTDPNPLGLVAGRSYTAM